MNLNERMRLPQKLTPDNFCALREDEDEKTATLYDWLHELFGDTQELDNQELRAMELAIDVVWQKDERLPLEGTDDFTLLYLVQYLTPFEQHAIWREVLGVD